MKKYQFSYWNCQGLAQGIKYLFYYKKIEFEDIKLEDIPTYFGLLRPELSSLTNFPNLPNLKVCSKTDDDSNDDSKNNLVITQTNAILRYLAKQHDLNPDDNDDQAQIFVDTINGVLEDLWSKLLPIIFQEAVMKDETRKKSILADLLKFTTQLNNHFKDNKFCSGDKKVTWVDFQALQKLFILKKVSKEIDEMEYINRFIEDLLDSAEDQGDFRGKFEQANDEIDWLLPSFKSFEGQWGFGKLNEQSYLFP